MDQVSAQLAAKFEGMLAAQIRELIDDVVNLVRTDNLWKIVKGAKFGKYAGNIDVGNAVQERVGKPRVDSIFKRDIVRNDLQGVMGKAEPEIIGQSGVWRPSPVSCQRLGTGMNISAELRQQLKEIHPDDGVITEEIRTA